MTGTKINSEKFFLTNILSFVTYVLNPRFLIIIAGLVALGSVIFRSNYELALAPLITNRIRIIKDKSFIMYLGASYSAGVNTWGMFYGTGYIF